MKWFRFYSEVLRDSKVQQLGPELFRAWINLLCLASEGAERGVLPELRQVAFALRISENRAAQTLKQLTDCGLLDLLLDGGYQPHNWEKRQRQSDDASVRMRRSRERTCCATTSEHVTQQTVNTFAPRSGRARSDSDSDSETEQPPLPPEGGAVAVLAPLPPGGEEAIETARARFGDAVAELVQARAKQIYAQLGGRWDLFLDALGAAQHHEPPLTHVYSWCMTRAKAKIHQPPGQQPNGNGKPPGGTTNLPTPVEVASRGCEHCSGTGLVSVFHPKPDPRQRIPPSTSADCVCPRGREIRSKRPPAAARSVPDLADVLADRGAWKRDPPGLEDA